MQNAFVRQKTGDSPIISEPPCSYQSYNIKCYFFQPQFLNPRLQNINPSLMKELFSIYPNATSSIIITLNPAAKKIVPMLECFPAAISGINSSTTT